MTFVSSAVLFREETTELSKTNLLRKQKCIHFQASTDVPTIFTIIDKFHILLHDTFTGKVQAI
jgi:hypothetical protein